MAYRESSALEQWAIIQLHSIKSMVCHPESFAHLKTSFTLKSINQLPDNEVLNGKISILRSRFPQVNLLWASDPILNRQGRHQQRQPVGEKRGRAALFLLSIREMILNYEDKHGQKAYILEPFVAKHGTYFNHKSQPVTALSDCQSKQEREVGIFIFF